MENLFQRHGLHYCEALTVMKCLLNLHLVINIQDAFCQLLNVLSHVTGRVRSAIVITLHFSSSSVNFYIAIFYIETTGSIETTRSNEANLL